MSVLYYLPRLVFGLIWGDLEQVFCLHTYYANITNSSPSVDFKVIF